MARLVGVILHSPAMSCLVGIILHCPTMPRLLSIGAHFDAGRLVAGCRGVAGPFVVVAAGARRAVNHGARAAGAFDPLEVGVAVLRRNGAGDIVDGGHTATELTFGLGESCAADKCSSQYGVSQYFFNAHGEILIPQFCC